MAATDVLTLDEALTAVMLTGTAAQQAGVLEMFVSAVSERLDDLCGPIVVRTVTETIDANGSMVRLTQWPVTSITTVVDYQSGDTVTADGYTERSGLLSRRSGWDAISWSGPVTVTYEAGRYATTDDVGAKFKLAAQEIIAREWPQYAAAWSRGGGVFGGPADGTFSYFKSVEPVVQQWLPYEMRPASVA